MEKKSYRWEILNVYNLGHETPKTKLELIPAITAFSALQKGRWRMAKQHRDHCSSEVLKGVYSVSLAWVSTSFWQQVLKSISEQ